MFNTFCFYLNTARLSWLVAILRMALHRLFAHAATEGRYHTPENTGYLGWVDVPLLGTLAFRRLDGVLQYRW